MYIHVKVYSEWISVLKLIIIETVLYKFWRRSWYSLHRQEIRCLLYNQTFQYSVHNHFHLYHLSTGETPQNLLL